ncbi:alpha-(1,6)-fucosyltransferase-like [Oppia nitens]|uniref:alpha-(1,6)-fucosyltransferase-like n=1 Tax=Oppia nitens TaxID=1686743 RepID=UPI0023DA97CE|nr:alpha-(1,6)-fucosyltransferase-like [Oppia nitens]
MTDLSKAFHSLDRNYFFTPKQIFNKWLTIDKHMANNDRELEFNKSDPKLKLNQSRYVRDLLNNLWVDLKIITKRDTKWRQQKFDTFKQTIDQMIDNLQNPINCKTTKKLVLHLHLKKGGFGYRLHLIAHSLVLAIALNRTLIFSNKPHIRENHYIFQKFFEPLSKTCLTADGYNSTVWSNDKPDIHSYQVIHIGINEKTIWPSAIPTNILPILEILSETPLLLYVGQIVKYITRPNSKLWQLLDEFKKKILFNKPMVGIHVRRTDKLINDAIYHSLDQYMSYVDAFYDTIDLMNARNSVNTTAVQRVVYLTTDDPNVWINEIKSYIQKGYVFKGSFNHTIIANNITKRTDIMPTLDLLLDVFILSECDYIVCTMSSNVCRLAVELMKSHDINSDYQSLDTNYYFNRYKI